MSEVTRKFTVPEKGIGRKDYSINVEESVISIARSHQYRVHSPLTYDITAYDWLTIESEPIFGTITIATILEHNDHLLYTAELDFDANVLIKGYVGLYDPTFGTVTYVQGKFAYGKIRFEFPNGYLITKEQAVAGIMPGITFLPGGYIVKFTTTYIKDEIA